MVGCNNPKIRPDYAHIELMKKCIANDIVVIASGCSAQAAAKAGLMDKSAKDLCGAGLKRVCELADIRLYYTWVPARRYFPYDDPCC